MRAMTHEERDLAEQLAWVLNTCPECQVAVNFEPAGLVIGLDGDSVVVPWRAVAGAVAVVLTPRQWEVVGRHREP